MALHGHQLKEATVRIEAPLPQRLLKRTFPRHLICEGQRLPTNAAPQGDANRVGRGLQWLQGRPLVPIGIRLNQVGVLHLDQPVPGA